VLVIDWYVEGLERKRNKIVGVELLLKDKQYELIEWLGK